MDAASFQFRADDITTIGVAGMPSDVVALAGFLGEGGSPAYRRLFRNEGLREWLAIPVNAIAGYYSLGRKENPTEGMTVVYVDRTASVVICESVPVSIYEPHARTVTPPRAAPPRPQPESQAAPGPEEDPATYKYPR